MICKLCGVSGLDMAKSHIIPRAFTHDLRGQAPHLLVIDTETGDNTHTQSGDWDDSILCRACEASFSQWDRYAVGFFRGNLGPLIGSNAEAQWFEATEYQYNKLKLFLLSLIWRASVTSKPFFDEVSLGPYEDTAAAFILSSAPGSKDDFPVMICKFGASTASVGAERIHAAPVKFRKAKHIAYAFTFGGFKITIWPGTKFLPESYHPFLLSDTSPLRIVSEQFDETGFFNSFANVMSLRQRRVS